MRHRLLLAAVSGLAVLSCGDEPAGPMDFTIEATTTPESRPAFTATGAAVDAGRLCAEGEAEPRPTIYADTGLPETAEQPPQDGDLLLVTFDFTCADGSGRFALQSEVTVDDEELDSVIQTGEYSGAQSFSLLEGSGSYEDVQMDGERQFKVVAPGGFDDGVVDLFTGTMSNA